MTDAPSLHENHRRVLGGALTRIDGLLENIEQIAAATSPFSPHVADLPEADRKWLADSIAQLRGRLLEVHRRWLGALPAQNRSARWSIRTHLTFVDIALEELRPSHLAGYGALDPTSASALARRHGSEGAARPARDDLH